jgi:hypothetical protein
MRTRFTTVGTVVYLLAPLTAPALLFGGAQIADAQQAKAVDAVPALPKSAMALRAGTSTYKGRLEYDDKKIDFAVTRTIKELHDAWLVIDTNKQPGGEGSDETILAKGSLVVRQRTLVQGQVKLDYKVKDGKAMGKMLIVKELRPILVDLGGGELFADGAGRSAVVAALPLAEGYQTSFRNLTIPSRELAVQQLKVVASERITVPAGTFDTFKVQVASSDGGETTFWIAKSPRKAVKTMTTASDTKGSVITTELQK